MPLKSTQMNSMGRRQVADNVNVNKPSNQKEALQMLNSMMH